MTENINNSDIDDFKKNIYYKYCPNYTFTPFIYDKVDRIVVFGDIHGDYKMTIKLLEMSNVAKIVSKKQLSRSKNKYKRKYKKKKQKGGDNDNDDVDDVNNDEDFEYEMEWIGGKTHVVQVGDQIDRCRPYNGNTCDNPKTIKLEDDEDSDVKILKLFTNLHEQAQKVGGAVISLLGNHELLNVTGEVQYVSFKGLHQFMKKYLKDGKKEGVDLDENIDPMEARKHAFQPGNTYGKFLGCTRNATVIIGSNLFVHAGIIDKLIEEFNFRSYDDIVDVNILIKKWLLGLIQTNKISGYIKPGDSMFWTRILGSIEPNKSFNYNECEQNLSKVLKVFKVNNMVIGHTPQSFLSNSNINGTCGNKLWRVDVGSSRAFDNVDQQYIDHGERHHNRRYQYLEILNDTEFHVYDEKSQIF
jgi:hypothetical protein